MDKYSVEKEGPGCANSSGPKSDTRPDNNINYNTSPPADFQAENSTFRRPGISRKTLELAGTRKVKAEEAFKLCGIRASGIWIPYVDIHGKPIIVNGKDYGRLRLDKPIGDMKYYQEPDTESHVYTPYTFVERYKPNEFLYLTEGEFKALALAEEGYQAAALPGFYGYAHGVLLPELKALLDKIQSSKIYFVGDTDTCLNYRFSVAAFRLAELVAPIPVLLPRLTLKGPKGVDDLKDEVEHE